MEIARVEKDDLPEILILQKLAYQSEAEIYNDYNIPPLTETLEDIEKDFNSKIILKVTDTISIIGSVRAYEKDGTCHIGKLMVHPEYRDRGIGRKLMGTIEKCFKADRYELFTGHLSLKNLALYKKLGYKQFKVETLSENVKIVYMEKLEGN